MKLALRRTECLRNLEPYKIRGFSDGEPGFGQSVDSLPETTVGFITGIVPDNSQSLGDQEMPTRRRHSEDASLLLLDTEE